MHRCEYEDAKHKDAKERYHNTIPPLPMQLRTLTFAPLYFRVHPNKMTSEAEDEILKIYFQQLLGAGVVLRDRSNWFCGVADSEAYFTFLLERQKKRRSKRPYQSTIPSTT